MYLHFFQLFTKLYQIVINYFQSNYMSTHYLATKLGDFAENISFRVVSGWIIMVDDTYIYSLWTHLLLPWVFVGYLFCNLLKLEGPLVVFLFSCTRILCLKNVVCRCRTSKHKFNAEIDFNHLIIKYYQFLKASDSCGFLVANLTCLTKFHSRTYY